jgi:hypothetical protein
MHSGKFVFSQIIALISPITFKTLVNRHSGDYKVKEFTCWKQFLCMAFGQLTHRESLSDTMLCLSANANKLYHLGIGKAVSLSTISRANENRSFQIYEDLAMHLISEAKRLCANESKIDLDIDSNVFAIDATTIDLCLSSFFWAKFRSTKSGIKLHTQIDLKTSIPEFILFTNAKVHDVNALDFIDFEADSFYVMDRGYVDFRRLYRINENHAYFITRSKDNMDYRRVYSHTKHPKEGIVFDQTIKLNGYQASKDYPDNLRLVKFYDEETDKNLIFLTNNFDLKATDIAKLYKSRWGIELFFKWLKQHLKVKSFWGQSENAVKTQIWIAVSVYVLVIIAKKKFKLKQSLYEILQVLSISIFEKMPINQLFQQTILQNINDQNNNPLTLWDL